MLEPDVPRGRLAPSPTGRLHLGHARTFLLAWLHVRSRGGELLLRLEDLDASRCRPELAAGVLRDLEWLGLDWDGPVMAQSSRLEALSAAARSLRERGFVYPCVCSRADLQRAVSAPQQGDAELRYAGTCRERPASELLGRSHALRFRVPEGEIAFVDGIAGVQRFDVFALVGDFIVANRAGLPSYQLAVVADDAAQGINEVFRGDDLLSSTPRQLLIARALGLPEPRYFHVPLVLDPSGRRLAKRADDLSLDTLRALGADPRAIIQWVMTSAGFEANERLDAREALPLFELSRLRREPVSFGEAELSALVSR
jgi:glutamyl-tRNA synthetase